ncbi:restriction endonuclease subunit S [Protaetiibacter mangrovi]|uniref:Restriction endonuclease subunit S n=1 Tax=Protaetiibacter mangrovi TaxID=2970926 RepID=A0ABT1ZES5_9MICO|nr:restriction endonuclease subunit S [Protaetiibacter mangrovi]MCS0499197.1 restriction endonuclease subunit S [Protaetiibacter mangrovi]TPX04187.1 restriction endonuclease subunit S [Schumannella luteola]
MSSSDLDGALDALPRGWEVRQIGRQAWVRARLGWKGLTADEYVDDGGHPMLATPNIKGVEIDFKSANRISSQRFEESPEIQLARGDVLLTKDGSTIGTVNMIRHLPEPATVNGSIAVISPRENLDGRFLYWVLVSEYAQSMFDRFREGMGVPHLFQRDINRIPIPAPPSSTQRRIADYLDRETAQIDTLISKQEQLIARLRERKQSTILRMTTRGTDSQALKDSTLEWIDQVPASWDVVNIRRVAEMKTGHTPSRTVDAYWENTTIPWFTLADVWQLRDGTRTYLGETANSISELGLANSAAELLPAGTVVLSRTASVGFTGIMPTPMATSQDFWNWVCSPALLPDYLVYVFRAMHDHFRSLMIGSTHKTIYQPVAAAIRIPLPPTDEQRRIVAQLDEQTAKIDTLIAKAERFIVLAKERRAALITAAVTGQLDVTAA